MIGILNVKRYIFTKYNYLYIYIICILRAIFYIWRVIKGFIGFHRFSRCITSYYFIFVYCRKKNNNINIDIKIYTYIILVYFMCRYSRSERRFNKFETFLVLIEQTSAALKTDFFPSYVYIHI